MEKELLIKKLISKNSAGAYTDSILHYETTHFYRLPMLLLHEKHTCREDETVLCFEKK